MIIKHIYQPDGISCGPTCLKMIDDHINNGIITIEDLKKIVGTNDIKGTTLDDMVVGLKHLNISYDIPNLGDEREAIEYLNNSLNNDEPIILRTLTKGIKHWVIVSGFDGQKYYVKDPWLGEITYNKKQIIKIWEPRGFDCLKIINKLKMETNLRSLIKKILKEHTDDIKVRRFSKHDKLGVIRLMIESFSHLMDESKIEDYTDSVTNYTKSIVVEKDGEIIGAYLLGDRQLRDGIIDMECEDNVYVDLDKYDLKNGVEGVALVVDNNYRDLGLGSKLKDYTTTLGVDYIWGVQYKKLGNLTQWLRRRKLAAENDAFNITVQDL
jgi:predicted double-glycine peptidase